MKKTLEIFLPEKKKASSFEKINKNFQRKMQSFSENNF